MRPDGVAGGTGAPLPGGARRAALPGRAGRASGEARPAWTLRRPRSAAGWTMAVFGACALVMGVTGLVAPGALLGALGFADPDVRAPADHTRTFLTASSMASLNMGAYYLLAAAADWRAFFRWTVPFRLLTCAVFTLSVVGGAAPAGFLGVGLWEGAGAAATGYALLRERR